MIHKAKKYPKLAEWKQVMARHRQRERQLEQKVKLLQDLLREKPLTPERLKALGKDVESTLPVGETLQDRMCRYCDMAGYEYRRKGQTVEYDTPSGTTVTIYPHPVRYIGYSTTWDVYGHYDRHDRHDRWGMKFIDEHGARHMYKILGEKIEELSKNKK